MAQLVARPTPDRKVGSSILSGLNFLFLISMSFLFAVCCRLILSIRDESYMNVNLLVENLASAHSHESLTHQSHYKHVAAGL